MDTQCLPFRDVPSVPRLFLDFLSDNPQLRPFYPTSTFSLDELADHAKTVQMPEERRQRIADVLKKQNQAWDADSAALDNIQKLRSGACAVVSGQQVGLFLGPAYTVYKAVTIIRLARELNARGVEAVPVFWLASEDHDLAEVNHAIFPDAQGALQRLETASHGVASAPVGTINLDADVRSLIEQIKEITGESEVLGLLSEAYSPGQTFATAFGRVMVQLFSRHGLIVLDPSDAAVHQIASPLLQKAATETESLVSDLLGRTKEIEATGHEAQVKVTPSSTLLFFLKDGVRVSIHKKNGGFGFNGEHWSAEDLRSRIEKNPELFTANVLLRPVLQDYLLPTAMYIAGPAETAYFAQVQVVYEHLLGRTTPVWPRFSSTLIEARLASWMRKYGLRLRDVLHPKDEFVSMLSRRTIPADIKDDFDRSREQLDRLLAPLLQTLQKLDPTIASAGEVAGQKMRYQLDQLESRAARAHLQREQVLDRHATLLSTMLFPERELQERKIAGIYFIAKHGIGLIGELIEGYKPECRDHQVIELA